MGPGSSAQTVARPGPASESPVPPYPRSHISASLFSPSCWLSFCSRLWVLRRLPTPVGKSPRCSGLLCDPVVTSSSCPGGPWVRPPAPCLSPSVLCVLPTTCLLARPVSPERFSGLISAVGFYLSRLSPRAPPQQQGPPVRAHQLSPPPPTPADSASVSGLRPCWPPSGAPCRGCMCFRYLLPSRGLLTASRLHPTDSPDSLNLPSGSPSQFTSMNLEWTFYSGSSEGIWSEIRGLPGGVWGTG